MNLDILHTVNAEREARRAVVVVTQVESGAQRIVKAADVGRDPLADVLEKHLRMAKSGMEETAEGRVFLTVHVPSPRLVITGAVHISQALAPMASLAGYDVTIVDPRTAFASQERFPDVKVIAESPAFAMSSMYQTLAHSTGILFENAIAAQQQQNTLALAASNQGVMQIYSVDTTAAAGATEKVAQTGVADNLTSLLTVLNAFNQQP